jgi:hypothetical protein
MGFLDVVAPTVATILGSPVAGLVVQGLGSILGLSEPTKEVITKTLNNANLTQDQIIQIKQLEADMQIRVKELELDLVKLKVDDVKSAREMQIVTRAWTPAILAYLITAGFFGILIMLMTKTVILNADNNSLLIMLGSLGTAWSGVINYYFGSTVQSSRHTELLAQAEPINNRK